MKFLFLAGFILGSHCFSLSAAEKPDVLVILADQWSPRYTSWDNKEVRTPHLVASLVKA